MVLLWLILLTAIIYWLFFRKTRIQLPGPRGLPLLGSVFQLDAEQAHITITEWAKTYGPVFVVRILGDQIVFVNDYDTIHDVLVRRGDEFCDRTNSYRMSLFSRESKDIAFSSPACGHWRQIRKAAHKYVKVYGAEGRQTFEELIGGAVNDRMKRIANYHGEPFDVRTELYDFTACILYTLLLGKKLEPNSDDTRTMKEITDAVLSNLSGVGTGVLLDVFPWLRMFGNKVYSDMIRANEQIDVFWKKHITDFQMQDYDEQPDCLVKYILNLKNGIKKNGVAILDDTHVKMAVIDLVVGGNGTTASLLSAFIVLLLHYPDVQRTIQQEVDAIVGSHDRVTLAKRDDMPYTRATIYELLRYVTVGPVGIPHAASTDTTIQGTFIPKGTTVNVNLWGLHHDDVFWGDPWIFRPERFLDEHGTLVPADHPNRKRFFPFGTGPRVCLGELFALNRMFLFIATLAQTFDVTMDTTKELPPCDPRTYAPGIVRHPVDFSVSMVTRDALKK